MSVSNEMESGSSKGLRISKTTLPDSSGSNSGTNSGSSEDQFLKVLLQDSQEITMVINLEGRIKYCNNATEKLLGFQPFKLLNNNVQRIVPVQQWVAFRAALRASEEVEERTQIDCQFIDIDDKRHHFSISVSDQRHHPLVEGYIVHAQAINRMKEQENKLKLRNLAIELIKEAVVIIEPKRPKIVFANRTFYELSGFTKQEILGGKFDLFKAPYSEMLFAEKTDPKQVEKFHKAIKTNKKYEGRIFSKKKNGSVFYNRFSLSPVLDNDEMLTHYIASMKVINQRQAK